MKTTSHYTCGILKWCITHIRAKYSYRFLSHLIWSDLSSQHLKVCEMFMEINKSQLKCDQKHVCGVSLVGDATSIISVMKSILLSRQKMCFVATNTCLSWQKLYLWQLPPIIVVVWQNQHWQIKYWHWAKVACRDRIHIICIPIYKRHKQHKRTDSNSQAQILLLLSNSYLTIHVMEPPNTHTSRILLVNKSAWKMYTGMMQ